MEQKKRVTATSVDSSKVEVVPKPKGNPNPQEKEEEKVPSANNRVTLGDTTAVKYPKQAAKEIPNKIRQKGSFKERDRSGTKELWAGDVLYRTEVEGRKRHPGTILHVLYTCRNVER